MVILSLEPKSQLRQFSSSTGTRVVSAPPMVVGWATSSSAKAAGTSVQTSTAASTSAAARRAI